MARNAFVPMAWITSDINGEALRLLILISTYADATSGECWPNNATMGQVLGKSQRSIQMSLQELKSAGLISMTDAVGRRRRIRIESPEWYDKPRRKPSPNHEGNLHPNHEENLHGPNKNTPIEHTQEHNSYSGGVSEESKPVTHATAAGNKNLEPFESGLTVRIPDVRNGVKPSRMSALRIAPTQFQQSTIDRIYQVLGTDGDDFAAMVRQDQADSGFVEWVLKRAETAKKPIGLAVSLLKTKWREGWTNPNAEEDAQYAELVEMMRRIQQ